MKIDIKDDGFVSISGVNVEGIDKAIKIIESIVRDITVGEIYEGKVVKTAAFGAFVELGPNKDGMIHISKLSDNRVDKVEDVVKVGDIVRVKVLEIDKMGKVSLSMRPLDLNS